MTVSKRLTYPKVLGKSRVGMFEEFKEELKKITWTTQEELKVCTKVVLGSIFALGVGIYAIDLSIRGILEGFSQLAHLIGF